MNLGHSFHAVSASLERAGGRRSRVLGGFAVGIAGALALGGLLARGRADKPDDAEERDPVDEASDESFPASDPPSFTPGHAGGPDHTPPPADGGGSKERT